MLRKLPYLPLFIQDFLTDEKLAECSAKATGVFIRLMCLMHKSEAYGKILLKQKDKQTENQIENFALKIAKHFPYDYTTVYNSLNELVNEGVLEIEGDCISQKRMVRDAEISDKRSKVGRKGGKTTAKIFATAKNKAKDKDFAIAKVQANTEYEIEYENDNKDEFKGGVGELPKHTLEAAELNQFTLTKNKNTDFILSQWQTFLLERENDSQTQKNLYKAKPNELHKYFLNWIRTKTPKNGTNKSVNGKPGRHIELDRP